MSAASTVDERDAAVAARIQHLFRAARSDGRIHPLQHLLRRYRQGTGAALPLSAEPAPPAAVSFAHVSCKPIASDVLHQRLRELPALPQAALLALCALRDDSSSSEQCAELIGRDQALAARALRLANSAFYGVPGRVGSIRDAVQLLGRRPLASLLTLASVSQQFDARHCPQLSVAGFWRHAIATALAARAIARALSRDEDQAFTVGLLHDIGRLVLAAHFPAEMAAALARSRELDKGLSEIESQLLGTDHLQVGAQVAAQWSFPADVVQALASHHGPQPAPGGAASLADTVHLADAVAHGLDLAGDPHDIVPALDAASWHRLALPARTLLAVFSETEAGVAELARLMGL